MSDPIDPPDTREAYEALQREIEQLRADLAAARAAGETSTTEAADLRRQLTEARERLAAAPPPPPAPAPTVKEKKVDGFYEVDDDE
jgi:hypothetical protein